MATSGGSQAVQAQSIWTAVAANPKILEWALKQVVPAIIGSHVLFATAANGGAAGGGSSSGGKPPKRSDDPGLDDFIDRLENAGIEVENVNVKINDATGRYLGEVDIVTKNAIIEYKHGSSSAYAVIKQVRNVEPNVSRPVVVFINDTAKAGARTVRGAGGKILITNDFNLLVEVVR